jgi:hypothetical protein
MRQMNGEKAALFQGAPSSKKLVDDLKGAQVEAELRCF